LVRIELRGADRQTVLAQRRGTDLMADASSKRTNSEKKNSKQKTKMMQRKMESINKIKARGERHHRLVQRPGPVVSSSNNHQKVLIV
jgi:hypothetical protein